MVKLYDALEKARKDRKESLAGDDKFVKIIDEINKKTVTDLKVKSSHSPRITNSKVSKDLVTFLNPLSAEAEQFRKIGSTLLFKHSKNEQRLILVTSAYESEGKSFLAANISICLAMDIQESVLLVDCDLRSPSIHRLFGSNGQVGLSEYFSKEAELSNMIHKTAIEGLSILPSGRTHAGTSDFLSSRKMSGFIKKLRDDNINRYVIIDAPPALLASETAAIATQVDGIILVINCGETPRSDVNETIKIIGKKKILGVVLNRFNKRFSNYGKYNAYHK